MMKRITCPKCGKETAVDNARFCTNCGNQLVTNEVITHERKSNEADGGTKIFDINETVPRHGVPGGA